MMTELKELIETQRAQSFRPEYRATVSDEEVCGVLLSHHFHWDGDALMRVAVAALTDANFHREAAQIERMRCVSSEA